MGTFNFIKKLETHQHIAVCRATLTLDTARPRFNSDAFMNSIEGNLSYRHHIIVNNESPLWIIWWYYVARGAYESDIVRYLTKFPGIVLHSELFKREQKCGHTRSTANCDLTWSEADVLIDSWVNRICGGEDPFGSTGRHPSQMSYIPTL